MVFLALRIFDMDGTSVDDVGNDLEVLVGDQMMLFLQLVPLGVVVETMTKGAHL
jgi:hypothetical protein